jgi:hypothetical protein
MTFDYAAPVIYLEREGRPRLFALYWAGRVVGVNDALRPYLWLGSKRGELEHQPVK